MPGKQADTEIGPKKLGNQAATAIQDSRPFKQQKLYSILCVLLNPPSRKPEKRKSQRFQLIGDLRNDRELWCIVKWMKIEKLLPQAIVETFVGRPGVTYKVGCQ